MAELSGYGGVLWALKVLPRRCVGNFRYRIPLYGGESYPDFLVQPLIRVSLDLSSRTIVIQYG
jgi:hypothetical protein